MKANDERITKEGDEEGRLKFDPKTIKKSEHYEIIDLQKTRNVPHLDGFFPCYIYIDVTTGLSQMIKAQHNFKERVIR